MLTCPNPAPLPEDGAPEFKIKLWEQLNSTFILKPSIKINKLLTSIENLNYKYFNNLYEAMKGAGKFRLIFVPQFSSFGFIFEQLRKAQEDYGGKGFDVFKVIYYCDLVFPENYDCEHGRDWKNVNIFLFSEADNTEDFIYNNILRFEKLKAFT